MDGRYSFKPLPFPKTYSNFKKKNTFEISPKIKNFLKLQFQQCSVYGECILSSFIEFIESSGVNCLSDEEKRIYIYEGIFTLNDDEIIWITFDELIDLLIEKIQNNENHYQEYQNQNQNKFPSLSNTPSTQNLISLFQPYYIPQNQYNQQEELSSSVFHQTTPSSPFSTHYSSNYTPTSNNNFYSSTKTSTTTSNIPLSLSSSSSSFLSTPTPTLTQIQIQTQSISSFGNKDSIKEIQLLKDELSSKIDSSISSRIEERMQEAQQYSKSKYSHFNSSFDSDDEDSAMELCHSNADQLLLCRTNPLSNEEESIVSSALDYPHNDVILKEKYKIPMTRKKISCLRPSTWLNDEVINFYMEMLTERDAQLCSLPNSSRKPSHFFTSYFISKLLENGIFCYGNVRRWTRKIDLFSKHKIFFPINISNNHWTLAVAYMDEKRIVYFDSLGGHGDCYTQAILDYFVQESRDKKSIELNQSEWKREAAIDTISNLPQQHNGSDCGMFTIMYADFISDDLNLSKLSQNDMKDYRKKTVAAILRGSLNYHLLV